MGYFSSETRLSNMFARGAFQTARSVSRVAPRPAARAFTTSARPAARSLAFKSLAVAAVGAAAVGTTMWNAPSFNAGNQPHYGNAGTKTERTFIAIKPDGVQRGLIGEIIRRFEARGYKLVGMKMIYPSLEMAKEHYTDLSSKPFYNGLCKYFSSGPIVAMVWEGKDVILQGRKLVGATNPNDSEAGSIRGDLCISVGRNIIHGSDGPDSAKHEISFWFKAGEVTNYSLILESMLYER